MKLWMQLWWKYCVFFLLFPAVCMYALLELSDAVPALIACGATAFLLGLASRWIFLAPDEGNALRDAFEMVTVCAASLIYAIHYVLPSSISEWLYVSATIGFTAIFFLAGIMVGVVVVLVSNIPPKVFYTSD